MSTWDPDEDPGMQELAEDTVPSLVGLVRGGTEQENPPSCTHHIVAAWVLSSLARASLRFQVRVARSVHIPAVVLSLAVASARYCSFVRGERAPPRSSLCVT